MIRSSVLVTAIAVSGLVIMHTEARGSTSPQSAGQTSQARQAAPPAASPKPAAKVVKLAPVVRRDPAPSPCLHNDRAQWIVVSIKHQHEWACAHHHTVLSTPVTTGARRPGDATPRGTFAVQGLNRNSTLTGVGDRSYHVKFWIPFHLGTWGFHDASWQKIPFGSKRYVTRGSHGCVHMPLAAIRRLFHWVHYGTRVRIR
jgi:lipoprotein-anchoring transpeptidase ErfK/SrfK